MYRGKKGPVSCLPGRGGICQVDKSLVFIRDHLMCKAIIIREISQLQSVEILWLIQSDKMYCIPIIGKNRTHENTFTVLEQWII